MNEFEGSGLSLDDVLEEEHGMISGTLMQKALRALEVRDATRVLVMEVAPFTPVDKLREYVDTMCEVNQMAVLLASRQTYGNVFMVAGVDVALSSARKYAFDILEKING